MEEVLKVVVAVVTGGGIVAGVVAWLLRTWLGARIETSIQGALEKQKLQWEAEHRRREKAQLVAELLAEWISGPKDPKLFTDEQRMRINKLSFEATLWLPEDIAIKLSRVLQNEKDAPNLFSVLLEVRSSICGRHNLTTKHVTHWGRDRTPLA